MTTRSRLLRPDLAGRVMAKAGARRRAMVDEGSGDSVGRGREGSGDGLCDLICVGRRWI